MDLGPPGTGCQWLSMAVRYVELPRAEQQRLSCDGVRCALLAGEALSAAALEADTLAKLGPGCFGDLSCDFSGV